MGALPARLVIVGVAIVAACGPSLAAVSTSYDTQVSQALRVIVPELTYQNGAAGGSVHLNANATKVDKGVATALVYTTYSPVLRVVNSGDTSRTIRIVHLSGVNSYMTAFGVSLWKNGTEYQQVSLSGTTINQAEGTDVTIPAGEYADVSVSVKVTLLTIDQPVIMFVRDAIGGGGGFGVYYLVVHVNTSGSVPSGGTSVTDLKDAFDTKKLQLM